MDSYSYFVRLLGTKQSIRIKASSAAEARLMGAAVFNTTDLNGINVVKVGGGPATPQVKNGV